MNAHKKPVLFRSEHKPRFFEMDPFGHMSMIHYLSYYSDHRFRAATASGLDPQTLMALDIVFYCARCDIEYKQPVFLDTEFTIESSISSYKGATAAIDCVMRCSEGKLLSVCRMTVVCIDKKSGRPVRWPPAVLERFFQQQEELIAVS